MSHLINEKGLGQILISPFTRFYNSQSFGGMLLFIATLLALAWANSPWASSYHDLWNYHLGFSSEYFEIVKPLILWVNDLLMAVFFFMIGLEIKRELVIGELDSAKKAALPFVAAIGGMVVPVALFFLLNDNPETRDGWGIPMATDIAFSLAILKLLGNRVPLGIKVFLTAFAIVDDLGAVLVIALFYSEGISWTLLGNAFIIIIGLFLLARKGIYSRYLTLFSGALVWLLFLKAGIHPTIAGVILAFVVPVRQKLSLDEFNTKLKVHLDGLAHSKRDNSPILSREQLNHVNAIDRLTGKVYSPLKHLEEQLHPWVAYFIMPVFALANAGISFGEDLIIDWNLMYSIGLALIAGKAIGISLFSAAAIKLKWADLPKGVNNLQVLGASVLAGVGFTMSIFIANLAYVGQERYMDSAKLGILLGSFVAGLVAYLILRRSTRSQEVIASKHSG